VGFEFLRVRRIVGFGEQSVLNQRSEPVGEHFRGMAFAAAPTWMVGPLLQTQAADKRYVRP
jgi:hypothetical protein